MEAENSECSANLALEFNEPVEDLPKICRFYTFVLVEELALEDNYSELRIGKCSVIGKLHQTEDGNFELENVKLPHMPSHLILPEGSITIRLLDFFICQGDLQRGRYCEVCGEVTLVNPAKESEHGIPKLLTTYDLQLSLQQFKFAAARREYLRLLQSTHKVAIKVEFVKEIDNASKLVEHNLALREFYSSD